MASDAHQSPPHRRASKRLALRAHGAGAAADDARSSDLESLYTSAEADMRAGRRDRARGALTEIVAREPTGARAEAALLDLARLALAEGNPGDARSLLRRLPERLSDPALGEPADHLRCSTEARTGDLIAAVTCYVSFRRDHPSSTHDAEALGLLAANAADCAQARPLLQEYLRRYARGPFASDARKRLAACE